MKSWPSITVDFLLALWWGSLTSLGAWVVPMMFHNLHPVSLAGQTAAVLFEAQTWASCAIAGLVLVLKYASKLQFKTLWLHAGWICALLLELLVAPQIMAHENLAFWHSLGSGLLVAQWFFAGILFWQRRSSGL
jgi:hypothetical protein